MKRDLDKLFVEGDARFIPLNFFNGIETPFSEKSLGEYYNEEYKSSKTTCSRINDNDYRSTIFYKNITSAYNEEI